MSGDTASGGLARLDWSVPDGTDAVIVELGANDALRGVDPKVTRAALDKIVSATEGAQHRRAAGAACRRRAISASTMPAASMASFRISRRSTAPLLYPFFLDGVAADAKLNQRDGIHPNAAGVEVIVDRILPKVEELVSRVRAKSAS